MTTVLLYLTHLQSRGVRGRRLRTTLGLLDTGARLDGDPPWSTHPDIRRLLRGLHQKAPLGGDARGQPLYRELVHALVDATMSPTLDQRRWRTALLLANATGVSAALLSRLRWCDVRLTKQFAEVRWRSQGASDRHETVVLTRSGAARTHEALRELWLRSGDRTRPVFASQWGASDYRKMWRLCESLPAYDRTTRRRLPLPGAALEEIIEDRCAPTPQQLRDRALLLVGFGAALTTHEATAMTIGDIRSSPQGVVIDSLRRRDLVGIPATGDQYCPLAAWEAWLDTLLAVERGSDEHPAFPQVAGSRVWVQPLAPERLNKVVARRADEAGLAHVYNFTNLRDGWIRTALRDGIPAHEVASHAGLRSLQSVAVHERRENLLRDNVAGRLGL